MSERDLDPTAGELVGALAPAFREATIAFRDMTKALRDVDFTQSLSSGDLIEILGEEHEILSVGVDHLWLESILLTEAVRRNERLADWIWCFLGALCLIIGVLSNP